jgi:maltooligosyltrehalose trehalohydrolase
MYDEEPRRRLPVGAEVLPGGGVHFRVWAPLRRKVEVVLEASQGLRAPQKFELEEEPDGYFSGAVEQAGAGALYRLRLDGEDSFPDPASRFQPEGPHGPSQVIDPCGFNWGDAEWKGARIAGQVIYEMHVGTFTREGTWEAASRELRELARVGITVIEVMPVAEFSGRYGWGYDGVDLFAPTRLYGTPDDFRRFVDRAHAASVSVILDVVYNHLGPDGCYLGQFSKDYFTDRYETEWGQAINFDGENSAPAREFFASNAAYWIDEFHLDGLRLDATQSIHDNSTPHILAEITARAREAAMGRSIIVVAENEPQETKMVRSAELGGYGMDALWNDDLHHSAMVALTGRNEAYYTDHLGSPQEFVSAVKYGYLFQGQRYTWQKKRRGTPALDLKPPAFVTFIQNHDQVANSGTGARVHQLTSPGRYRALTSLLLLAPGTPMLFQGQEFAASSPFLYFADHKAGLAELVSKGRKEFVKQFPSLALEETQKQLADPADLRTFERCRLDFAERERNRNVYEMHHDLLKLRREDPVISRQGAGGFDGAVLGNEAFLVRFFAEGDDRLLIVNFGRDLRLDPAPEPLLAPPENRRWQVLWTSEDQRYGGMGTPDVDTEEGWRIQGHAAVLLLPVEVEDGRRLIEKNGADDE